MYNGHHQFPPPLWLFCIIPPAVRDFQRATWSSASRGNLSTEGAIDLTDDKSVKSRAQRNQEPQTIDTAATGSHASGNSLTPAADVDTIAPRIEATGLIWIEQEDQAKQGMARKGDMRQARAAPDHPHVGHVRGSGESQ
jgi:lipopolysaccharide export system protein LptC